MISMNKTKNIVSWLVFTVPFIYISFLLIQFKVMNNENSPHLLCYYLKLVF